MTSLLISKRLQTIADFCPPNAKVADIGSDHALLSSYLLVHNIASFVIAGELNEGPYQAAQKQIATLQARDRASVRKGDGLTVIEPNEVDTVCIAGMGGQLITSILEAGKAKLAGVTRLILQPNVGEEQVRRWLIDNGWQLIDETIIDEDGVIYEILVAERGDPLVPYQGKDRNQAELLQIGPFLYTEKSPILKQKWELHLDKWEKIHSQMQQSDRPETHAKLAEVNEQIHWIKGVLTCLQTDKRSSHT